MKRGQFPGMPGNMNNMMKQVQKMQKQMEEAQAKLDETEVTGSAGGGMVEAVVNGKKELLSVKIKLAGLPVDAKKTLMGNRFFLPVQEGYVDNSADWR